MAALTTTRLGNWSDTNAGTTPWTALTGSGPGGVPGDGDTVTITHAVVLDVDATIGLGGATGTAALAIGFNGTLTINTGVTLTCKGDINFTQSGSVLTLNAGATLDMYPANGAYYILNFQNIYNAKMICNGTAESRCTVRTNADAVAAGGLYSRMSSGGGVASGLESATFTDFQRWGTTAAWGIIPARVSSSSFSLTNCIFENATLRIYAPSNVAGVFLIEDNQWTGTLRTGSGGIPSSLQLEMNNVVTTGSRSLKRNYFAGTVRFLTPKSWQIENNIFNERFDIQAGPALSFVGNFIRDHVQGPSNLSVGCEITDCYYYGDSGDANEHGFELLKYDYDQGDVSGMVLEAPASGVGDLVFLTHPTTPRTVRLRHCIVVPSDNGLPPGKLVNTGRTVGVPGTGTMAIEHCTMVSHGTIEGGLIDFGEGTGDYHPGTFTAIQSNLVYRPTGLSSGGYFISRDTNAASIQDIVAAANCDYNGSFNLLDGQDYGANPGALGKGYYRKAGALPLWSTGQAGAHDVEGDPQFVDATRDLASWAVSRGSVAATPALRRADALTYLQADPTLMSDLLSHVRAGFAPQNPAFKGTAHDGTDIGAVAVVVQSGGGMFPAARMRLGL